MKNPVKSLVFVIIYLFILFNISSISYADEETDEAIAIINEVRQKLGINQLENNLELQNAALTHSKYMDYYNSFSIVEESGNLYFRGRYPWDRAQFFEYGEQYITELITNNSSGFSTDTTTILENPYGRIDLLNPKYQDIGMNNYGDYYSYMLGGEGSSQTNEVVYPYDNQINIPISWSNEYRYSPYSSLNISNDYYGLPITYSYYSIDDDVEGIVVNNANVTYNNQILNFDLLQPGQDIYLTDSIIIVPKETYEYDTTYSISLDMIIQFEGRSDLSVTKAFSFQTERDPDEKDTSQSNSSILLTRAIFTEEMVKAVDYPLLDATNMTFTDVDVNSIRAKYIFTAYYNNLIRGQSDEIFAPDLNITRQEAYTILVRAFEDKINREISFTNISPVNDYMNVSTWAMDNECVLKAAGAGFLVTNSYNNLIPQGHVSEKEFWDIITAFRDALDQY